MISDYSFYTDTYHGKLLSAEEFPGYATRADEYLNELTFGRYAAPDLPESVLTAVKMAECAVADLCLELDTVPVSSDPSVSSETVGSHSVTYRSGADVAAAFYGRIRVAAEHYLLPTGLLYRGATLRFTL